MNLPENLKKKRDVLVGPSSKKHYLDISCASIQRVEAFETGFNAGFDAAAAELLPMIEKLECCLEILKESPVIWSKEEGAKPLFPAKDALEELKKWRES